MSKCRIHWQSPQATLFYGDALKVLKTLPAESVDCIITSPPYYGQRDYGAADQLGLEETPFLFIKKLVKIFSAAHRVLKPTGSLWVNLGDTYWSGKGQPQGADSKNKNRRFARPQDRTVSHPVCRGKQLLLIPQRFAIAMQDAGWIVRNEIIWSKVNPTPDPVQDRLAVSHEQFYFFVKQPRNYFFDRQAIALPRQDKKGTKNAPSVWHITSQPTFLKHIAPFQSDLLKIPLRACLPPQGVLLDPFCGSATALKMALDMGESRQVIGIDVQERFLAEATSLLSSNESSNSCGVTSVKSSISTPSASK